MDSHWKPRTPNSRKTFGHEPGLCSSNKMRRRDDEGTPVQMPRQQRGHEGFAKADHVRQKHAAIIRRAPCGVQHGVFLIFELFEIRREIGVVQFVGQIERAAKIFVEEFEIKFVGRELRVGRLRFDGLDEIFRDFDGTLPKAR